MGKTIAQRSLETRIRLFPETIMVTRIEEDGSHYFLAHEDVGDVPDDTGDVAVYERRMLGTVKTDKQFIRETN